jgi:hypothetical protein
MSGGHIPSSSGVPSEGLEECHLIDGMELPEPANDGEWDGDMDPDLAIYYQELTRATRRKAA